MRFASANWLNQRILLWALYDVASSTYIVLVPAIIFPIYFREHLAVGDVRADAWWGLTAASGLLLAGAAAPVIGALADKSRARTACLAATTAICCTTTAVLGWAAGLPLIAAAALYAAGQAAAVVSQSLYDSYVAQLAPPEHAGRVSGFGWGVGFTGGILATGLVLASTVERPFEVSLAEASRAAFLLIAALYSVLSIPALVALWQIERDASGRHSISTVHGRGWPALLRWREHRELSKALVAVFLINDALVTIALFVGPYFTVTLGLTMDGLLQLVLLYHVLAAPATYAFGVLSDRWDVRRAILASLGIWGVAILLLAIGRGPAIAMTVIGLFALGFGSTQSLCRTLLSRLVPQDRAAEFFGFGAVAGRLSAATGPLIFGVISSSTGSQRVALLSMLLFLGLGAVVLGRVAVPAQGSWLSRGGTSA